MPHLPGSFKKMVGKGQKMKGTESHHGSVTSDTGSSFVSRTNTNVSSERPSLDSASSIYSHQTLSASGSPGAKINHVTQPATNICWLDGIVNNPYGYRTEVSGQTSAPKTNPAPQTIATTASFKANVHKKAIPIPPGNDQDRGYKFAGSLRKSRPQSIWFRPEATVEAVPRVDPIANFHDKTLTTESLAKLDRLNERDEALDQTKQEIRRIKVQDVDSTRNALCMARQAFEVGSSTLNQLQQQGDRLNNAEKNLDEAVSANTDGAQKLKALKHVNRMISVRNPFTEGRRENKAADGMLATRQSRREEQDRIRAAGWQAYTEKNIHKFTDVPRHRGATPKDILSRAKYQFEPDSDDEELEDVIEGNLDEIADVAEQLKGLALAQGEELHRHNGRLDQMKRTAEKVAYGLASNRAKLDRFH